MNNLSDLLGGAQLPEMNPLSLMQLASLRPALKKGLDPGFGYSAMQNIIEPYMQPPPQLDPGAALSAYTDLASTNPNPAAADALTGMLSTAGYDPQMLSGFQNSAYPTPGQPSPFLQQEQASLDSEDLQTIQRQVTMLQNQGMQPEQVVQTIVASVQARSPIPPEQEQALVEYVVGLLGEGAGVGGSTFRG